MKKMKLLAVLFLATSYDSQAAMNLDSVLNMGTNNALTLAAAMALAEGAYCYSQREFDDKGTYRTVGGEDDSAMTDLGYSCAYGTGMTVLENISNDTNQTLTANAKDSVFNAICFWITKQISRQDAYKNINRNSFLLRWVPINTKFDDGVKQLATFAVVRSLLSKMLTPEVSN